jgi:hypothetical protein
MKFMNIYREVPEPLKAVLSDYCHVEWYEVNELADDVKSGVRSFDVSLLKAQFEDAMSGGDIYQSVNKLTANEFDTDLEAQLWLRSIYEKVFV